jgi:hypothetical protein
MPIRCILNKRRYILPEYNLVHITYDGSNFIGKVSVFIHRNPLVILISQDLENSYAKRTAGCLLKQYRRCKSFQ